MTTSHVYNNITWIDINSPKPEEVKALLEKYKINPEISRDLLLPSPKSQIEFYEDLIYLVLHFPVRKHSHRKSELQEIDFLIGKEFVVTIHYEASDPIDEFAKYAEVSHITNKEGFPHAGFFFFELIKHIYGSVRDDVSSVTDDIKQIEPNIFSGREREAVHTLSLINRALLGFKDALGVHTELLEMCAIYTKALYGKGFDQVSYLILNEHKHAAKEVDHVREVAQELWNTNTALLSTKQNEVMKNLTMISFITFPLSLIVAIFGLKASLGNENPQDFWILLGILILATAGMIFFFKKKQWL